MTRGKSQPVFPVDLSLCADSRWAFDDELVAFCMSIYCPFFRVYVICEALARKIDGWKVGKNVGKAIIGNIGVTYQGSALR